MEALESQAAVAGALSVLVGFAALPAPSIEASTNPDGESGDDQIFVDGVKTDEETIIIEAQLNCR